MLGRKCLLLSIMIVLVLCTSGFLYKEEHFVKPIDGKVKGPIEKLFYQYLDHFNPTNLRKWKQRYFTNDQYYKLGGPVFLLIGGEEAAKIEWMTNGAWIDYAKRFGALCFMLEHRFHGKSRPTEDTSMQNLRYFTIEQALSDLATFIVAMSKKYSLDVNTRWIAFGGSYPGSLALWLRLKYPHLIHGAVSSSSVVLATIDYSGYLRVISEVLRAHSAECEKAIRDGTVEIDELLQHRKSSKILNTKFQLCDPIEDSVNNKYDIANFYRGLAANFAFIQSYKVNFSSIYGNTATDNITLDMVCDIMTNKQTRSLVERLADVNTLMLHAEGQPCLDYRYDKIIDVARNTSWNVDIPNVTFDRLWWYQLCTELGLFPTSSFKLGTFGNKFPVEYYTDTCMNLFGPELNATFINNAMERMNTTYGGFNLTATNTVVIQGSIDPWHPAGILRNITDGPAAIFIDGTAHMADMAPSYKEDLPQLKSARKQIIEYIRQWLQQ